MKNQKSEEERAQEALKGITLRFPRRAGTSAGA